MYCSKCGAALTEGAVYCSSCGAPVAGPAPAVPIAPNSGEQVPDTPEPVAPAARPIAAYAGFWLRFVALVLDAILLFIPFTFIIGFLAIGMGLSVAVQQIEPGESLEALTAALGSGFILAVLLIMIVGSGLYFALLECSSLQGSLGKKILGLYVTDTDGNRISFGRASGRFFAGKFACLGVPGLGFVYFIMSCIFAGVTPRKQALHDMIASCLVMRKL
jgi:uncharacterized RDD family membrane protein YckC